VLAVADEATIKSSTSTRGCSHQLTDPRKTTEAQAQQLIRTAKPIYWLTSGMHSDRDGGPEMLMELAYRLAVRRRRSSSNIRNNVITFITPVIEVDGREKQVDTYYFNKKRPQGEARLPLMYWGKYVAHDNNRDGMGQFLALTQNVTKFFLEWTPQVLHDLHESVDLPLRSTGTGPTTRARSDHRRRVVADRQDRGHGDDQARRARRVDLRLLRRLDAELPVLHRARAQRDRPLLRGAALRAENRTSRVGAPRPAASGSGPTRRCRRSSGARATTVNIQQSGVLFALEHFAKNRETYLENYYLKNKRGREGDERRPTTAG
jgi:hypothetical protein